MAKKFDDNHEDKEMESIRQHLDRQDKAIVGMEKKLDEVLILLGGSIIGKTKGLVAIVDELSGSLEQWSSKFMHAEKWRVRFMEGEAERKAMVEKKKQLEEDRVYHEQQKDKEIAALKRSNQIKNWLTIAAVVGSLIKFLYDQYNK